MRAHAERIVGELSPERCPRTPVGVIVTGGVERLSFAVLVEAVLAYHECVQDEHDEDGRYTRNADDYTDRLSRTEARGRCPRASTGSWGSRDDAT